MLQLLPRAELACRASTTFPSLNVAPETARSQQEHDFVTPFNGMCTRHVHFSTWISHERKEVFLCTQGHEGGEGPKRHRRMPIRRAEVIVPFSIVRWLNRAFLCL